MRPWAWVGVGVLLDLALIATLAFFLRDGTAIVAMGLAGVIVLSGIGWLVDGVRAIAGIVVGSFIVGPVVGYFVFWLIALAL